MTRANPFDFAGRTAIVTGAGRGLGRAIAIGFADAGAKVMVAGRTEADILETAGLIAARGGTAAASQFDAAKADACAALVQATIAQFGALD